MDFTPGDLTTVASGLVNCVLNQLVKRQSTSTYRSRVSFTEGGRVAPKTMTHGHLLQVRIGNERFKTTTVWKLRCFDGLVNLSSTCVVCLQL